MQSFGVLLLAYGGPNSLDDIPAYLRNIRGGQLVPPPLIDETTRRYRMIGGYSPLCNITRRLASKLQKMIDLPVCVGMRHWHPFIADTVDEMMRDGIEHIVAICLAPHYSPMSIGAYRAKLENAIAIPTPALPRLQERQTGEGADAMTNPSIDFIDSWHTQPQYIAGIAQNLRVTLARFPEDAKVIFTAHSLPITARAPYESQLRETAQFVAQTLGLRDERWMLCYQSQPRGGGEWLEPQIENVVPQLARDGVKNLVIAPIGFLADHLEVLYDIDIAVQDLAHANDVRVARTPMLNDSDALVNALVELVEEKVTSHVSRITGGVRRDA